MSEQESFTDLELDAWVPTAERHRDQGYRLVQMTGTARADHFEIMISYDKDYRCNHYRVCVPRERPRLPSLSGVFLAAFTYENELKDLFGFEVPGLAVDYGGGFLRTKTKIPFSGKVELKTESGAKAPATKVAAPSTSGSTGEA
ncbi:NADH-quinone oxidoreductase subunit C [Imhoffiella purpurea]|uniref:Energy-conserving hydrogenase (Ferredoxin), subunit D n=1 Tax=Imhoffiella purpurea TaxID=1249627 RepID=W9VKS7_9GAMM|nr:NADH-quinone oxidoreductase subunit C [Imhoffiella purpurea]EXJ16687.1 Energy-conserving hydrogenase (ferredoxin), subunit D [Imhoffiella purpurea]